MEKPLLNDPEIYPSDDVLKSLFGPVFGVFEGLRAKLARDNISFEWHYYRDAGPAWLCKVVNKKKTVFWLSVWDGFFKASFYFLERHLDGLAALNLDDNNCKLLSEWGKMLPLIFDVRNEKPIPDLLKKVEFKKKSK
jgi:hypothetical protein